MRRGRKARGLAHARPPSRRRSHDFISRTDRRARWRRLACRRRSVAALLPAPPRMPPTGEPAGSTSCRAPNRTSTTSPRTRRAAQRQWMRDHYARMRTWAPYFDSRLDWYPNAWAYRDAYAIYRGSDLARAHPEWILKDAGGSKLYIPWGCTGGTCPQYAADIGNPAFRAAWIAEARATLARGYKGLYVDDVNMSCGSATAPGRSRPDRPAHRQRDDRGRLAALHGRLHGGGPRRVPGREIVHNAIWYAGDDNADVRASCAPPTSSGSSAASTTPGSPTAPAAGRAARSPPSSTARTPTATGAARHQRRPPTERLYGLAGYLLVTNGRDLLGNGDGGTPDDWWAGYDVELGDAAGQALPLRTASGAATSSAARAASTSRASRTARRPSARACATSRGDKRAADDASGRPAGAVLLRDGLDPTPAAGSPPAAATPRRARADRRSAPGRARADRGRHAARQRRAARRARGHVTVRVRALQPRTRGVLRVSGRGARRKVRSCAPQRRVRTAATARSACARRGRSGRFAHAGCASAPARWRLRAEYRARVLERGAASASRARRRPRARAAPGSGVAGEDRAPASSSASHDSSRASAGSWRRGRAGPRAGRAGGRSASWASESTECASPSRTQLEREPARAWAEAPASAPAVIEQSAPRSTSARSRCGRS